jgi:hypothetical protein
MVVCSRPLSRSRTPEYKPKLWIPALRYRGETYARNAVPLGFYRLQPLTAAERQELPHPLRVSPAPHNRFGAAMSCVSALCFSPLRRRKQLALPELRSQ